MNLTSKDYRERHKKKIESMKYERFKKDILESIKEISITELTNINEISSICDHITNEVKKVYPKGNSRYFVPTDDYHWKCLDAIGVFDGGDYWHFVTYGLSTHFEDFDFELTMKLKKTEYENVELRELEIKEICLRLNDFAHYFCCSIIGIEWYNLYYHIPFCLNRWRPYIYRKSKIESFMAVPETKFNEIEIPNGKIQFVQLLGITKRETNAVLESKTITCEALHEKIGSDLTDFWRESVQVKTKRKPKPIRYDEYIPLKEDDEINIGDKLLVIGGPFVGLDGVVSEISKEKLIVTLSIKLFDTDTPVEIDYNDLSKGDKYPQ